MFEEDSEGNLTSLHHPFTAPLCRWSNCAKTLQLALSRAYDMVLNGTELGGGSICINQPQMQEAVFEVLGIGDVEAREKFGFLLMPSAMAVRHTVALPSASIGLLC